MLQISVPAFSLCHFPKMWVSLVNTLNPRPKEHITASCSVGNRLRPKRLELGEAFQIGFHLCNTLRKFCISVVWLHRQMLSVLLIKLQDSIQSRTTTGEEIAQILGMIMQYSELSYMLQPGLGRLLWKCHRSQITSCPIENVTSNVTTSITLSN